MGGQRLQKYSSKLQRLLLKIESRKILAMAYELNDVTAALNIYVIKGCHQPWTGPNRGCFSPVLIFLGLIFRKWAGRPFLRHERDTEHQLPACLVGEGPLGQGMGETRGWAHTRFLEKVLTPLWVGRPQI